MSVEISVSNNKENNNDVVFRFLSANIEARVIETRSVFNNKIEYGYYIVLGKEYINKKKLAYVWSIIQCDYDCAHIKINSKYNNYSGCIFNYLYKNRFNIFNRKSFCPNK